MLCARERRFRCSSCLQPTIRLWRGPPIDPDALLDIQRTNRSISVGVSQTGSHCERSLGDGTRATAARHRTRNRQL